MAPIAPRTTIFEQMSARASALGAINLGQGFPDSCGPVLIREAAAHAVLHGPHHYPRMRGTDELRHELASFYADRQQLAYDPAEEIVVTSGGTEALASAILGLLSPGDEAILIEPCYDAYAPLVRRAGAVPRFVTSRPPEWRIEREALEAQVTSRTRLIIVNDPVNPTGRMLDEAEQMAIQSVAVAHDLKIIADEVWEEVRPEGRLHVSLASHPLLRDRVVKIGSAGKIFQLTGWKVGWAMAAAPLARMVAATHQFLTFTTPPALQAGVAAGLRAERDWLTTMRQELAAGRAQLADGLASAGWAVLPSEATWFLTVDLRASGVLLDDMAACEALVERFGVAAIPVSAFYETASPPRHVIRLCHAKGADTLALAIERLAAARAALSAIV